MTWPQAEHRLPVASVDGATSIRAAVRRLDQAGTGALLVLDAGISEPGQGPLEQRAVLDRQHRLGDLLGEW
jgi:hypothetical protein